ncbi:MAG: RecQ family ATP-dependent DNA helicase [Syntrophobacterales bacterium]|nr:RecQ family ATP-dependent DNA helicase [Syntrophobacterales bacterium]
MKSEIEEIMEMFDKTISGNDPLPEEMICNTNPDVEQRSQYRTILKTIFGYDTFWPLQEKVIAHILEKKDALVVMPTGGGKSLCYQIPGMIFEGLTIVVSPLISLMKDQVDQLWENGVPALFLNSSLSMEEYRDNVTRLRDNSVKFLYLSPEALQATRMLALLAEFKVDCLAIDEAHCISEWGHDFRPEYRMLADARRAFPSACCVALTATATPRVRADIRQFLNIDKKSEYVGSFNRPNLFLEVAPKTEPLKKALALIERYQNESGIIYCGSRRQTEELYRILLDRGYSVRPYHAGLSDKERRENQERFSRDDIRIIVATIAFGMGINKPNVRFVIHYDLPASIDNYYQEIGRAGRDGLPAHCLLLFGYGDIQKVKFFIRQKNASEQQVSNVLLKNLIGFAETHLCRRIPLLNYFGETDGPDRCDMCDNCRTRKTAKELDNLNVPEHMRLSDLHKVERGETTFSGRLEVVKKDRGDSLNQNKNELMPSDVVLFEMLREKRKEIANQKNVYPFFIFYDRTLIEMATYYPVTRESLSMLYGMSSRKLEEYADTFLDIIKEHCEINDIQEQPKIAPIPESAFMPLHESGSDRHLVTGELFNQSKNIKQLGEILNIQQETVLKHLYQCLREKHTFRENDFLIDSKLTGEQQQAVLQAFARLGTERLRPVFEDLKGTISYNELHLLRLYHLCRVNNRPVNRKDFICLAVSRKYGGYCLAGKAWNSGKVGAWIRPVSSRGTGELSREEIIFDNGVIPKCMDIISIDVQGVKEHPYQKENFLIGEKSPCAWQWKLPYSALPDMADDVSDLWMTGFHGVTDMHDRVSEEELKKAAPPSLYLIKPDFFTLLVADDLFARKKVRARFSYRGTTYTLSVTDPVIEKTYLMKQRGEYPLSDQEIYLTISMGEPFNGYCYKLIAAVITME